MTTIPDKSAAHSFLFDCSDCDGVGRMRFLILTNPVYKNDKIAYKVYAEVSQSVIYQTLRVCVKVENNCKI